MQEIYIEDLGKFIKNKDKIEKELKINIQNKGKIIFLEGSPENEYLGLKVLESLNLGFSLERALLLKDEEIILQIINIKDLTKRNDLERIRARIIGTCGKTIKNLNNLTNCFISLHDNSIGIIGNANDIKEAIIALKSLIQGAKQSNVYARLEKEKKKKRLNPKYNLNIKNELKKH